MKKSKLSITLVTSFIAAMAMSACSSSVKTSKEAIVTFTPYGESEPVALITNDVYNQYKNTSAGVSKFYDKILEVLIRYEFKEKNFDKGEMTAQQIENWAKNQVTEQKEKAKANAKSNGTSYDSEWKSILKANNVEDSTELKEKFIYDKEKEVIKNWYADNDDNADALKEEFIGIKTDGTSAEKVIDGTTVKSAMPYHIRHILVKVDEASDAQEKFYKGTISEAQAKLLYNTVSTLAEGKYNFAEVAKMYSEDGSASAGGDVGIMTNNATSGSLGMVSEFQLGLYAYDNLYDAAHKADAVAAPVIKAGLGLTEDVVNKLSGDDAIVNGVVEIPYDAFKKIGDYANVTADKYGNKLANGSTALYPRNILWNKYLNIHNVFVIKNATTGTPTINAADDTSDPNHIVHHVGDEFLPNKLCGNDKADTTGKLTRFNSQDYLVDENGNVIVGVRSQYGIHFMVIEKSMYEYAEPNETKKSSSLATYYSTAIPSDGDKYNPDSYVGYIESPSSEDYKKRADEVKSKITSFDATYDYRLFTWLTSADGENIKITFSDAAKGLEANIESYIKSQKANNVNKQEEGLEKVWKSYTRLLAVQKANREANPWKITNPVTGVKTDYITRLVSEQVAKDFFALYNDEDPDNSLYENFKEGGRYTYYA